MKTKKHINIIEIFDIHVSLCILPLLHTQKKKKIFK